MNRFKDLKVWQKSIDLTTKVYQLTEAFPSSEKHALTSQMTRCAVSIPSNIAEGCGRNSDKYFRHFLSIAQGSAFELETQLIISGNLGYTNKNELEALLADLSDIQNMIAGLQKSLKIN